jgi:membrane-bound lytic murein transglycosylase D
MEERILRTNDLRAAVPKTRRVHTAALLTVIALLGSACASQAPLVVVHDVPASARPPVTTITPSGTTSQPPQAPKPAQASPSPTTSSSTSSPTKVDPATLGSPTQPGSPTAAGEPATDPLRPEVAVNLDDRNARNSLWDRIRGGYAINNLDSELVKKAERYYAQRPDYVQRMTDRGSRYLYHIVEEVQRRKLPTDLALLPFVESAFNPEAMSRASASGMWQFMPGTGRTFNLKQNVFRDDRRDVLASTNAALDYLVRLHKMFGDWHLALAAYNWGEGNVQRAIRRNRASGLPTDYESLRMPGETRFYIPKLQAIKNIVAKPDKFGLKLQALENHPYFLAVTIDRDIDVERAAKLAGLPVAEFKALNPQISRPVILAAGTPRILLPYDNAATFLKALPKHQGALASWTAWTVPTTMKSADAAKQVGMSEDQFRSVNDIPPRMLVKVGSTVLVPRSTSAKQGDVTAKVADTASINLAHEGPVMRRVSLKVGRKGDSVASIAKRHGVTASQVAQWNGVAADAKFKAGSTVTLQLAAAAVKTVARKANATKRGAGPRVKAKTKPKVKRAK